MRLTEVRIDGLKGAHSVSHTLSPVTFFSGVNGSGKSTVIDAVRLALRGQHPDAGRGGQPARTNDDVLQLASADVIEVSCLFAGETTARVTRRWERRRVTRGTKKGAVETSATVQVQTDRLLEKKEAEAWIDTHSPSLGLDLSELLGPGLTDTGRRKVLLAAAGRRSKWTREQLSEEVQRRCLSTFLARNPWNDGGLVDYLTEQSERASTAARRVESDLGGKRDALTELEGSHAPVDPHQVGLARAALTAAEAELARVTSATEQAEASSADLIRRALEGQQADGLRLTRLATVRRELAAAQAQGTGPSLAGLRREIGDLTDELSDGAIPCLQSDLVAATNRRQDAQATLDRAEAAERDAAAGQRLASEAQLSAGGALHRAESEAMRQYAAEQSRLARLLADVEREAAPTLATYAELLRLSEEAAENLDDPTCPTCLSPLPPGALDRLAGQVAAAEARIQQATSSAAEALSILRAQQGSVLGALTAARDAANASATEAQTTALRARHDLEAAKEAAKARAGEEGLARVRAQIAQDRLQALQQQLAVAQAGTADALLASLQERERGIMAEIAASPCPDDQPLRAALAATQQSGRRDRSVAQGALDTARAALSPLEQALALEIKVAELRASVGQLEQDRIEALRVEAEIGPKGLMGRVLTELLGPLIGLVNEVIAPLNLGVFDILMTDERNKAICRPGLRRGDTFSPVETLSDGERASVLPVLLPALADLVGSPWRVLIADALERLDSARRERFVRQVVALVRAGRIDQAILAGCPDSPPNVEGCVVVTVWGGDL